MFMVRPVPTLISEGGYQLQRILCQIVSRYRALSKALDRKFRTLNRTPSLAKVAEK